MTKLVHEVFAEVAKKKSKQDKIKVLKENESWALKDVLRGSMDSNIVWDLPEGTPPYNPAKDGNEGTNLLREHKKFGYFVKNGKGKNLKKIKREMMFISMLEGINPNDAKLVIDMIAKKPPKGITRPIVEEAFPGLLPI